VLIDYKEKKRIVDKLLGDIIEPGFIGTSPFSTGNERLLAIGSVTGKVALLDIATMEVVALRQVH